MKTLQDIQQEARERFSDRAWGRLQTYLKVGKKRECWDWAGSISVHGYGVFFLNGKTRKAHRVVYELLTGTEIPQGLVLDHVCRNTKCVNPEHLDVVSDKENILRGVGFGAKNARKTHCPQGHEFTKENTYINSKGSRECFICRRKLKLKEHLKATKTGRYKSFREGVIKE